MIQVSVNFFPFAGLRDIYIDGFTNFECLEWTCECHYLVALSSLQSYTVSHEMQILLGEEIL